MATPSLSAISSTIPGILASSQMASGDNTVFTVATAKAAKVSTMTVANVSGAAVAVTVSLVPAGGTVDGTHRISSFTLAASDSVVISEVAGAWLGEGAFISVNAAAATAIDVVATGLVFS